MKNSYFKNGLLTKKYLLLYGLILISLTVYASEGYPNNVHQWIEKALGTSPEFGANYCREISQDISELTIREMKFKTNSSRLSEEEYNREINKMDELCDAIIHDIESSKNIGLDDLLSPQEYTILLNEGGNKLSRRYLQHALMYEKTFSVLGFIDSFQKEMNNNNLELYFHKEIKERLMRLGRMENLMMVGVIQNRGVYEKIGGLFGGALANHIIVTYALTGGPAAITFIAIGGIGMGIGAWMDAGCPSPDMPGGPEIPPVYRSLIE